MRQLMLYSMGFLGGLLFCTQAKASWWEGLSSQQLRHALEIKKQDYLRLQKLKIGPQKSQKKALQEFKKYKKIRRALREKARKSYILKRKTKRKYLFSEATREKILKKRRSDRRKLRLEYIQKRDRFKNLQKNYPFLN